jgi:hypothetical protein
MDVLSDGRFVATGVLSPRTFCPHERFVHGRFVSGRFVSGCFVWAPVGYLSAKCLRSAELFLLEQAQKGMTIPGAKQLIVDTVTEEDINGVKRKLIVIGSRGRNQIKGMYGPVDLPVLARDHRLSELYVRAAHEEGHEGAVATLHRSRRKVWITNGRVLADSVRARCTECRLKTKKCMEQRRGPLPNH